MNSCILMAKIVTKPELRYTQESQKAMSQMMVEFESSQPNEKPATIKVVGWGNLATDIEQNYGVGDEVILVGRLSMVLIDKPEGYKEKRAELSLSNIYHAGGSNSSSSITQSVSNYDSDQALSMESAKKMPQTSDYDNSEISSSDTLEKVVTNKSTQNVSEQNYDDIPF